MMPLKREQSLVAGDHKAIKELIVGRGDATVWLYRSQSMWLSSMKLTVECAKPGLHGLQTSDQGGSGEAAL